MAGEVDGNFVRDTSQTVFESLYQGHPDIKGVWAANGGTATGVMTALKNAGKKPGKDVVVVAMDLNPENVEAVKNGDCSSNRRPLAPGRIALVMLYDQIQGKPVPKDQDNVKLKLLPLTKDRIAQFEADFPAACRLMISRRTRASIPRTPRRLRSNSSTPSEPPRACVTKSAWLARADGLGRNVGEDRR